MTLGAGSRLGPYEIVAPIGAGGMGEVYRARDPRLGREVAIKVLPASFSADPDRLRRFEQEAKAAGLLNHPNITSVYDVGTHDGAPYVVTELLEGETLRSALATGKLATRRALDYGLQMARGLAAAHEKGIVHRDLKPENLFVTRDGRVKILDFGLAKLTQPEGPASQATSLPTAAGTEPGVVLGTLGYMSPEQVRGKPADPRSDIFAFGAILYEMLSGRRAFSGDSAADAMSAILKEDPPDLSVTNQSVSPGLERVVRHCLEKNPEQRFHSAHDLAFDLESAAGVSAPAPTARAWSPPRPVVLGGAVLLALLAGVLLGRRIAPAPPDSPEIRPLTYSGRDDQPAGSPDGKTVAFSSDRDGRRRIWLKEIAGGNEVALTDGPRDSLPRFSPDGSSILFTREEGGSEALYRCPLVGGAPRRLVADSYEGDWSPDGRGIAFLRLSRVPEPVTRLGIASADGSNARIVAEFHSFLDLKRPRWTPDGRAILVVQGVQMGGTRPGVIHWISSDGSDRRTLSPPEARGDLSSVVWSDRRMVYMQARASTSVARTVPGQILLQRPGDSNARVLLNVSNFGGTLDVLEPGRLVFDADLSTQSLREFPTSRGSGSIAERWITRGRSSDRQPFYSPDGKRIVFASDRGGNLDVWEIALATGALRRLTDDPAEDWDPELSPDGKSLVWSSNRSGHFEIWMSESDGSDPRQVTHDGVDAENPQITPDGRWITYGSMNPQRLGLWKIHPDGSGDTRLVAGPAVHPEISPDGSRVLYHVPFVAARVVSLADGKPVPFSIELKSLRTGGRSRWFPDGRSIALIGSDANGRTGVFVQEFSPELADTSQTRRPLAGFDPDRETDTFGISPDGSRVVLSQLEVRSDILIAERVPEIAPASRAK
jgi:eukaryotic-like serine/threonine-protein kinase